MNIGIFIDNKSIASVDCGNMAAGNPGIGGAAYSILLLAEEYKSKFSTNRVTIFATAQSKLPVVDCVEVVIDLSAAIDKCVEKEIDIFVIRPVIDAKPLSDKLLKKICEKKVKTIAWAHNFYDAEFASKLSDNPYIVANVFVGRQQYDYYIDHKLIKKSVYIYNMYPQQKKQIRVLNDGKTVTYIGSLVHSKGFHILAMAWKSVLAEVPDAQLYVIGSGTLYSREAKLGSYGIADANYEEKFIPYLLSDDRKLLPSVRFLGTLGTEKDEIISKTSVGIVNPSGRTETFGISALDFESQGVPVVTVAYVGFLDTIKNNVTGILYNKPSQISKKIVELLKDISRNQSMGDAGVEYAREFEPHQIIGCWHELFCNIISGVEFKITMPDSFLFSQLKWIKIINRKLKNFTKLEMIPAIVSVETFVKKRIARIKR